MPQRHLVDLAATATRLADNRQLWVALVEFDPVSREPNYKQCAVRVETSAGANS